MQLIPSGARGCPKDSARSAPAVHACLIKEAAQVAVAAWVASGRPLPKRCTKYKVSQSQANHPIALWVRARKANYMWTLRYARALNTTLHREREKVDHGSYAVIRALLKAHKERKYPEFGVGRVLISERGEVAVEPSGAKRARTRTKVVYMEVAENSAMAGCSAFPLLYQMDEGEVEAAVPRFRTLPLPEVVRRLLAIRKPHLFRKPKAFEGREPPLWATWL